MRYVFADCVLDTALATLHPAGRIIPLRPKVFHLLQHLLEQRAHLVTKDVLCAQVWPGQYISDTALEGCIKLARQAIGDSGREQQLIQTRRGYGYRFVGAVEEQVVGAALGRPEPTPALGEAESSPAGAEEAMPRPLSLVSPTVSASSSHSSAVPWPTLRHSARAWGWMPGTAGCGPVCPRPARDSAVRRDVASCGG